MSRDGVVRPAGRRSRTRLTSRSERQRCASMVRANVSGGKAGGRRRPKPLRHRAQRRRRAASPERRRRDGGPPGACGVAATTAVTSHLIRVSFLTVVRDTGRLQLFCQPDGVLPHVDHRHGSALLEPRNQLKKKCRCGALCAFQIIRSFQGVVRKQSCVCYTS
jgi:hypothetical protein